MEKNFRPKRRLRRLSTVPVLSSAREALTPHSSDFDSSGEVESETSDLLDFANTSDEEYDEKNMIPGISLSPELVSNNDRESS